MTLSVARAIRWPLWLNAMPLTLVSRSKLTFSLPVATSQIRAVLSQLEVASSFPFGLKASSQIAFPWPRNDVGKALHLITSQTRSVPPTLPVARLPLSGLNARSEEHTSELQS